MEEGHGSKAASYREGVELVIAVLPSRSQGSDRWVGCISEVVVWLDDKEGDSELPHR
jgi:hypothetical protein